MKSIIIKMMMVAVISSIWLVSVRAQNQNIVIENLNIGKTDSVLLISMDMDATSLRLKSDREVVCTPVLANGDSMRRLQPVVFAGRNRYIQNERHDITTNGTKLSRSGKRVNYEITVPYLDWMENATLSLDEDACGCGQKSDITENRQLAVLDFAPRVFCPIYVLVTPPAEVEKKRKMSGSAYIDFPVNKTAIYPDYRRNPEELASIRSTIDVVAKDSDTKITAIRIEGFASPEGSYVNNERLAKGRAESLAEYVRSLYAFNPDVMQTSSVAENWQGLRKYISTSTMLDTAGMLAIIDNTALDPDAREAKLKNDYPKEYAYLLKEVYPGLRRSDYEINYTVRTYTKVEEIKEIIATSPGKLSVNEIYFVANTLEPTSDEYREAFELAVRLFPDDEAANLNMASIAMQRNELTMAQKYLAKAGDSPSAEYARGIYEAKIGNYKEARQLLEDAYKAGVKEADDAIKQLERMKVI